MYLIEDNDHFIHTVLGQDNQEEKMVYSINCSASGIHWSVDELHICNANHTHAKILTVNRMNIGSSNCTSERVIWYFNDIDQCYYSTICLCNGVCCRLSSSSNVHKLIQLLATTVGITVWKTWPPRCISFIYSFVCGIHHWMCLVPKSKSFHCSTSISSYWCKRLTSSWRRVSD